MGSSAVATLARPACFAFAMLLSAGCGRFGYDSAESALVDGAQPDGDALSDGASPDGTTGPEGGVDAGATGTCADRPGAIFCSTFDSAVGLTAFSNLGQAQLVNGVLDAVTLAPGGNAYYSADIGPITSGTLHLRMRMRIVGDFAITNVNPVMIGVRTSSDFGIDFNLVNGGRFEVNAGNGVGGGVSAAALPRDTWLCITGTMVVADGTNGSVDLALDGAPLVSAPGTDTLPPPPGIVHVSMGIDWTGDTQVNARIQLDDLILDDAPIPCP